MVKEFHARNRYACYTKNQIQEKERELKRDYKMLKEAQRQSGCSWNKDRFMIEGGPHLWNNLIITFPKIKKFRNPKASFPLFDALGELYDGHLAEGNYNFTSLESPQEEEPLRQILEVEDEVQDLDDILGHGVEDEDIEVHRMEDDDASVQRNEDMLERRVDSLSRDEESEAPASAERTRQQRKSFCCTKKQRRKRI